MAGEGERRAGSGAGDAVLKAMEATCGACPDRDACHARRKEEGPASGRKGRAPISFSTCHHFPEHDMGYGGADMEEPACSDDPVVIALAGNANVGKSVIFNQLTGLSQTIGNWPGKTVERAEGCLHHEGRTATLIDLPGIYSLSTYTQEEEVTRDFIASGRPDVVVNVVDATALERNLYFTLQLMEMGAPLVLALNQMDMAERKGFHIDTQALSEALGVPVVPTVAIRGEGVHELVHEFMGLAARGGRSGGRMRTGSLRANGKLRYGSFLEKRIRVLSHIIRRAAAKERGRGKTGSRGESPLGRYPSRWLAIKCLEEDAATLEGVRGRDRRLDRTIDRFHREIREKTGGDPGTAVSKGRYAVAHRLWEECTGMRRPRAPSGAESFAHMTTHPVWGYVILLSVVLGMFFTIMILGGELASLMEGYLFGLAPDDPEGWEALAWNGAYFGFVAGISVALPYLVPFFIFMAVMEDSGYLARVAFLMDSTMHRVGLHGKAIIPIILGYGCTVPAVLGTRIMETRRERLIAAIATTMVPCSARTVVILALVAAFVGFQWALALYAFNLLFIFVLGRIAYRVLPGEGVGLIMEMPDYRVPSAGVVLKQTWARLKEFLFVAIPIIVAGSVGLEGLHLVGWLDPMADAMSPVTVWWLGLPAIAGIVLFFGILKKEMTLVMLAALGKTANFSELLTPLQMMVFTIVVMFYVPCLATIAVLVREFGWSRAAAISIGEIAIALVLGGLALRLLAPVF